MLWIYSVCWYICLLSCTRTLATSCYTRLGLPQQLIKLGWLVKKSLITLNVRCRQDYYYKLWGEKGKGWLWSVPCVFSSDTDRCVSVRSVRHICVWHLPCQIKSINRLRQVEPQCLVSFSEGDLTVVMETHCESTKEVTDDIDMTNISFSEFCPLFFLFHSLLYTWPICLRRFPLISFCSRPHPSLTVAFIPFHPVHALLSCLR